jgi:hypothetical protein
MDFNSWLFTIIAAVIGGLLTIFSNYLLQKWTATSARKQGRVDRLIDHYSKFVSKASADLTRAKHQ